MMKILIGFLVAVAFGQAIAEKMRFDNHTVYRITLKSKEIVEVLKSIEESAYLTGYNFYSYNFHENVPINIVVPPEQADNFQAILNHTDVDSELLVPNIQKLIDEEGFRPESKAYTFGWTDYYTLDEINAWLRTFAARYSDRVTLVVGGKTFEGRDILGVKISHRPDNAQHSVFIEANIHAREWITSAVATYFINELVVSNDPNIRDLAASYDFYIFPVTNSDGFEYSHTKNRMWRKTRTQASTTCFGTDPNRNWPYQWMQAEGASDEPCSETYAGPSPLSEPSTQSLASFISSIGPQLEAYISFHSYSQLLLIPYGHTTQHLDNYDELMAIGRKAISDLASRYGTTYIVGNVAEAIYIATGISMDWVKHEFGTPITYTYELRDQGSNGFILPADQIVPTSLETIDSLVSIFRSYRQLHPRH